MNSDMRQRLREVVIRNQEFKQYPYVDEDNTLKIGFAHSLERKGITINQALDYLNEDLQYYMSKLDSYIKDFLKLSEQRQIALIALCQFIGWQNVIDHALLIETVEKGEFDLAATELFKLGYIDLAFLMRSDEF